jgi:hypothetical protein
MRNECQSKNPDTCRVHGVKKLPVSATEPQQLDSSDEKYCKACNTTKPLSEFYSRGKNRPNEYQTTCKTCVNKASRATQIAKMSPAQKEQLEKYYKKRELEQQSLRICSKCKQAKSLEEYRTKAGELYYQICQACRPDNQREYVAEKPEVEKQRRSKDKEYRKFVADYIQPLKEAGCADCGRYFPDAMDFDHTCPPEEKLYNIATIHTVGGVSKNLKEMLEAELAKGEFVCKNCHRKRTVSRNPRSRRAIFLLSPNSSELNEKARYAYTHLAESACVDCEETNLFVLEFDHVSESKKDSVSRMILDRRGYTVGDVKDEIAKCEVRCSNCHSVKTHARMRGLETTNQEPKDKTSLKCPKCDKRKTRTARLCYDCSRQEKAEMADNKYGDLENLLIQLRETSFVQVAKAYNVSDNAIRKYLKSKKVDIHTLRVLE